MGTGTNIFGYGRLVRLIGRIAAAVTLALLPAVADAQAQANTNVIQISSSKTTSIKIAKGKPKTIKTNVPFYEIVIGDPEIANVNPLTDSSFYVLGNNLGTTGIALFDENKQLVGSVDIEVTLDTDKLASTIRDTIPGRRHRREVGQRPRWCCPARPKMPSPPTRRRRSRPSFPARRRSSIRSTSRPRSRSSSTSASSRSTARSARSSARKIARRLSSAATAASRFNSDPHASSSDAGRRRSSDRCCPAASRSTSPSRRSRTAASPAVLPSPT